MSNDEHFYRNNNPELMDDNEQEIQAEAVALPVDIPEVIWIF